MSTEKTSVANTVIWVFLLAIAVIVTGFIAFNAGKNSQPTFPSTIIKVDNTQALQDCIAKNVTPLQAYSGGYNVPQQEQIALDACKAEYPVN